jgi:hypothetical protein
MVSIATTVTFASSLSHNASDSALSFASTNESVHTSRTDQSNLQKCVLWPAALVAKYPILEGQFESGCFGHGPDTYTFAGMPYYAFNVLQEAMLAKLMSFDDAALNKPCELLQKYISSQEHKTFLAEEDHDIRNNKTPHNLPTDDSLLQSQTIDWSLYVETMRCSSEVELQKAFESLPNKDRTWKALYYQVYKRLLDSLCHEIQALNKSKRNVNEQTRL